MSLSTRSLVYGYPSTLHIEVEDFTLQPKEKLTLVGENGSGKTTLLRTLSSYLSTISGDILLGDTTMTSIPKRDFFQRVAFVDFKIQTPPLLRVRDLFFASFYTTSALTLSLNATQKQSVEDTAKQFEIQHLLDIPLGELSDGQRQKVIIASALVKKPDVLLLDEPTIYLDIKQKAYLLEILKALDKTLILSTHDIEFADALRTSYLFIGDGKAVYQPHLPKAEVIKRLYS